MKRQIVAILAIIAVITALITVSAVSNEEGYKVTPCNAIDISLENTTVTDFLNATNMTTVQVYNFKGYKGENTWMVQWFSSNRLLDVYVTVATGDIVGIEKITVPEALKAWVVANYGDGTRVTSDGWRRLSDAEMANTLAPLPAGYTKADITDEVMLWAMDNPNWEIQTICGWINSIGVTNLTEDHGLYVYNLAINWTVAADSIYDTLSPKPSRLPAALATEDNGRAVYYYAIGWNTIANEITGCNFWTTPTRRLIDTVEIGVEIVGPTPTPSVTPTPTPETKTWHSVTTFRDRSDKETPTFSIKGDIWCMVWQTVGHEDDSSISVIVYKEDLSFYTWVDGFSGNGADTYCIYKGPGSYYLDIDTTALEYWEIIVEDYY